MLKSTITGSCVRCMFSFLESCQTVFHSGYTILQSHQHYVSDPISLHPRQHLVVSLFLFSCPVWYVVISHSSFLFVLLLLNRELLIVVLICVSLVAKYVEYLFMCYLYILFGEVSPSVFADFLNGLFSYCRIFRVLCVCQVLVLSLDMQFANIFSQSVACLFILFTGYFAKQKLLILMKSIAVSTFILTFCVQSKPAPGVSPLVPSSHLKPLETQTLSVSPQGGSAPQWSSSLTHSTVSFRKSDQIH